MLTKELNGRWEFCRANGLLDPARYEDVSAPADSWKAATVPGDIHNDLLQCGLIDDPYYSDNLYQCREVTAQDWIYKKTFSLKQEEILKHNELQFDGIDTYADIFLNGKYLGSTENMFLQYSFEVSDCLRAGENELLVYLKSVKKRMEQYPSEGYFGCFNVQRIFMRKAQCHFSWDWAPEFPATGIWESVRLVSYSRTRFASVALRTLCTGEVSFFTSLDQETYEEAGEVKKEYILTVTGGGETYRKQMAVTGCRTNFSLTIDHPHLWWPQDLGTPFLYSYVLEYYEDGVLADSRQGEFGIREVAYREQPKHTEEGFTSELLVNGVAVFLKGANWVPLDIMTGRIPREKYEHSLRLAKEAGFNCLRVWGGGIYEKNLFYELCNRLGIMVWQDFAFACGDVPDDDEDFVDMVIPEIEYQIKRLRNHPCVVLWSGGNEKTGSVGKQKSRGDRLIHYTLNGMVAYLDRTRPYFPSSPWSYGEDGNSQDSGDSHCNSYQSAMTGAGVEKFRDVLMGFTAPMASEIAVQGCSSVRFLKTFLKDSEMWPPNAVWDLHMTRNPYDGTGTTFAQQQQSAAEKLFGSFDGLEDYVRKSMAVHSEFVKSDIEYHRTRKGNCSAAMLWMYSDVWPCGTWAIVDYNLLPKAAYYSAKRANRPILPAIVQTKAGIRAFVINDTRKTYTGRITIGQMTVGGESIFRKTYEGVTMASVQSVCAAAFGEEVKNTANSFLYMELEYDGKKDTNVFFHRFWKDIEWPEPGLHIDLRSELETEKGFITTLKLRTEKYARMVSLDFDSMESCIFSDNYFDMIPGEERVIQVESPMRLSMEKIGVSHWAGEEKK